MLNVSDQLLMFLLKCRNPKVFGDRREDTVHLDGQLSVVDILRSRRQQRLAREAAEEAAAKAAAITVDPPTQQSTRRELPGLRRAHARRSSR